MYRKRKLVPSPTCTRGQEDQTIEHILQKTDFPFCRRCDRMGGHYRQHNCRPNSVVADRSWKKSDNFHSQDWKDRVMLQSNAKKKISHRKYNYFQTDTDQTESGPGQNLLECRLDYIRLD